MWINGKWEIWFTRSDDGGQSFTSPGPLKGVDVNNDENSEVNFGPQPKIVVYNDNDTTFLFLVWADEGTGGTTKILFARSISLGDTFELSGIEVSHQTGVARHPWIAVDNQGNIYCVFEGGLGTNQDPHPFIYFNKSTDRGLSFMPQDIRVNDEIAISKRRLHPCVTVHPVSGKVFVVWEDSRYSDDASPQLYFSYMEADSFVKNIKVNTGSGEQNFRPAIFMDYQGVMVVAWHSNTVADDTFSINLTAYSDTLQGFLKAKTMGKTFTGSSGENFGNNFYPPSLLVDTLKGKTTFFLVWQDYKEDPEGDIYFVKGYVVISSSDLDIHDNILDVTNGLLDFGEVPAENYKKAQFLIVNSSENYNPDTIDGPSKADIIKLYPDTLRLINVEKNSSFIAKLWLPEELKIGDPEEAVIWIKVPDNSPSGVYEGKLELIGLDTDSTESIDTLIVRVTVPYTYPDLEKVKVYPNPFDASKGHKWISFTNLSEGAEIKIFDSFGTLVKKLKAGNDGGTKWYPVEVSSGVYIYLIKDKKGNIYKGKLGVIK